MNKNVTNISLRRGITGIISLKTFQVNIFQIYATQRLGYCLMEKIQKALHEDWQHFPSKETFFIVFYFNKF